MATAGYSGTALIKKLGIQPDMKVGLINEPENYQLLLKQNISTQLIKKNETPDLLHLFAKDSVSFTKGMKEVNTIIAKNNKLIVWVSWYKKSSGIKTDITEDVIRNYALQHNLVDIKVCAVSEIWSGLKLVVPLAKRK
ncbi:MAG: hypothetical protein ABJA78_04810 [Ferruginibacter sp.]